MSNAAILCDVPIQIPWQFKLIIFGGFAFLVSTGLARLLRRGGRRAGTLTEFPEAVFERRPTLLSRGELAFFNVLEQAAGSQFRIAMKVRLGDLVDVRGRDSQAMIAKNKTWQKHVDFVLCTVREVEPVLAIELDDSSHAQPERTNSDLFKDRCLQAAGMPLLRVACRSSYDPRRLVVEIQNCLMRR